MKRIISILTAAVLLLGLLFTLTGCSDQKKLIGTWEAQLNLAQAMMDEMDLSEDLGEDFTIDDFTVKMILNLQEDGTYTASIDETSMKTAFDGLLTDMEAAMRTMIEKEMEASGAGMSADQLLELLGMSMDELISSLMDELRASLEEEDVISESLEESKSQGKWNAKSGKLYLSDDPDEAADEDASYEVYKLDGSTMTWTEHSGEDILEVEGLYPIVWNKAA